MAYSNENLYLAPRAAGQAIGRDIANVEADRGLLVMFQTEVLDRIRDVAASTQGLYHFDPLKALVIARLPNDPQFRDADRETRYMPASKLGEAGSDATVAKQKLLGQTGENGLIEVEITSWDRPRHFDEAAMQGLLRATGIVSASGHIDEGRLGPVSGLRTLAAQQRRDRFFKLSWS